MKAVRLLLGATLFAIAASGITYASQVPTASSAAPLSAPPVTRDQVIASAKASTGIAQRIDRIEAKLTTFADIQAARGASNETFAQFEPDQEMWVVAIGGDFAPQFARGRHGTWGAFLTDAVTGKVVGTLAGSDGSWPEFFVQLADRAPAASPSARP